MPRYEPWEDHELAILYEYAHVAFAVPRLVRCFPHRTYREIHARLYRLRKEAGITKPAPLPSRSAGLSTDPRDPPETKR